MKTYLARPYTAVDNEFHSDLFIYRLAPCCCIVSYLRRFVKLVHLLFFLCDVHGTWQPFDRISIVNGPIRQYYQRAEKCSTKPCL